MQNILRKAQKIVTYALLAVVAFVLSLLYSGNRYNVFEKDALSAKDTSGAPAANSYAPYAYADVVGSQGEGSAGGSGGGGGSGGEGAAGGEGGEGSSSG
jgi:uncharacterized membrane protein YgcG